MSHRIEQENETQSYYTHHPQSFSGAVSPIPDAQFWSSLPAFHHPEAARPRGATPLENTLASNSCATGYDDLWQWTYNTGLDYPQDSLTTQSFYEKWSSTHLTSIAGSSPMLSGNISLPSKEDAFVYIPDGAFAIPQSAQKDGTYSCYSGYSSSGSSCTNSPSIFSVSDDGSSIYGGFTDSPPPSSSLDHYLPNPPSLLVTPPPSSSPSPSSTTIPLTKRRRSSTTAPPAKGRNPRDPPRPFRCAHPGCDRYFISKYTLKVHSQSHCPKPKVRLACAFDGCSENFSRQHDRLRHEVLQHGRVCEFVCDECHRFFSTRQTLQNHKCPVAAGCTRWAMSQ